MSYRHIGLHVRVLAIPAIGVGGSACIAQKCGVSLLSPKPAIPLSDRSDVGPVAVSICNGSNLLG